MFDGWNDMNEWLNEGNGKPTNKGRLLCCWSNIVDEFSYRKYKLFHGTMPKNANVMSGHGWDGETEHWYIIINNHYIEIDEKTFDEVNQAMQKM